MFRRAPEPGAKDLQEILERIAERIGKALERRGVVERDIERAWLALDSGAGPMDDLLGNAITYRIAVGPNAGQKLFMLQTLPARRPEKDGVARTGGFTLHAGVRVAPGEHRKRERLCRYASRPPVAADRLALTPSGLVRYALKTPYRDGTTYVVLEPAGADGAAGGAGAAAPDAPDEIPRGVRPASQAARGRHTGSSRRGSG